MQKSLQGRKRANEDEYPRKGNCNTQHHSNISNLQKQEIKTLAFEFRLG